MDNNLNQAASGQNDDGNRLRITWHVMLERRWLIITIFCLSVLVALIWAFRATPIFESVAVLQIDPETAGVLNLREGMSFTQKDIEYFRTQEQNLRSRSLVEKMSQKLNLKDDNRYKTEQDQVQAISDDITIEPVRQTRLIKIRVAHPSPKTARDMANSLVEIFLQENLDRKRIRSFEGYRMLKQELKTAETELNTSLKQLQDYRVSKGAVSLVDNSDAVTRTYLQAKETSEIARAKADQAKKLAEEAKRWRTEGKDIAEFSEIAQDLQVAHIKAELGTAEAQFASIAKRYRPMHPNYAKAAAAIASQKEKLVQEASRAYEGLISKAAIEVLNADQALNKFQVAEKEVEKLSGLKVDYEVFNRQKTQADIIYQLLITKTKEYDLARNDVLQNMTLIDKGEPGTKPIKPRKPLILALGVVGGLALAISLAFLMNHLDDSVKSQEDVEDYLRLPFLGYIPNIKSVSVVERDLQAHMHPTSSAAEGFRTLRASVALARNADKLRNIAVSSTIPSEGKSLVASNFAIVTAQTGLKTLLVDADLRRPSVHKAFQLQSPVGLAAYLAERVNSVDEIIHSTDIQNLDVVCCGALPSNPSELVSSKRMVQFLEEVSKRYDRIVLDCPPVSAVADPLVVGAMCDGLLFVTKFNKIRREHAMRSVQRIHDAGIHTVGLVLNDIDFEGKDSYYYSYHYYQNRYYASHYRKHTAETVEQQEPQKAKTKG